MRAFYALIFTLLFASAACALDLDTNKFEYSGSDNDVNIQDAKYMKNGSQVSLVGRIVKKAGKNRYVFRDETGEITAKMVFEEGTPQPKGKFRIAGKLEREFGKDAEINVDHIEEAKEAPKSGK